MPNPNHDAKGEFSSGPGGGHAAQAQFHRDQAAGHRDKAAEVSGDDPIAWAQSKAGQGARGKADEWAQAQTAHAEAVRVASKDRTKGTPMAGIENPVYRAQLAHIHGVSTIMAQGFGHQDAAKALDQMRKLKAVKFDPTAGTAHFKDSRFLQGRSIRNAIAMADAKGA